MRWLKRNLWKAGIVVPSMLLLLVLILWLPASIAGAHERVSRQTTSGTATVQATPTEDATVTALTKEKLTQEVQQLKNQNASDIFGWLRTNASILLSTLVVVIGSLIGFFRWLGDRRDEQEKRREDQLSEQEKRAEERFQTVVEGLGSEREATKVGAAITLRTFLRPGYELFYIQVFDLAVAHLLLLGTSKPLKNSLPLTTLRRALIADFKEAFPLVRSQNKEGPQSLDASRIQLDNAYLKGADLQQAWIPQASLRDTNLNEANLSNANLSNSDLSGTKLEGAILKDTDLRGVKGLTKEQKEACKAKGAIIDEASITDATQSSVSPSVLVQGDARALSVPSAQSNTPTLGTNGNSGPSSQSGAES